LKHFWDKRQLRIVRFTAPAINILRNTKLQLADVVLQLTSEVTWEFLCGGDEKTEQSIFDQEVERRGFQTVKKRAN
jgi:hypothetical protein